MSNPIAIPLHRSTELSSSHNKKKQAPKAFSAGSNFPYHKATYSMTRRVSLGMQEEAQSSNSPSLSSSTSSSGSSFEEAIRASSGAGLYYNQQSSPSPCSASQRLALTPRSLHLHNPSTPGTSQRQSVTGSFPFSKPCHPIVASEQGTCKNEIVSTPCAVTSPASKSKSYNDGKTVLPTLLVPQLHEWTTKITELIPTAHPRSSKYTCYLNMPDLIEDNIESMPLLEVCFLAYQVAKAELKQGKDKKQQQSVMDESFQKNSFLITSIIKWLEAVAQQIILLQPLSSSIVSNYGVQQRGLSVKIIYMLCMLWAQELGSSTRCNQLPTREKKSLIYMSLVYACKYKNIFPSEHAKCLLHFAVGRCNFSFIKDDEKVYGREDWVMRIASLDTFSDYAKLFIQKSSSSFSLPSMTEFDKKFASKAISWQSFLLATSICYRLEKGREVERKLIEKYASKVTWTINDPPKSLTLSSDQDVIRWPSDYWQSESEMAKGVSSQEQEHKDRKVSTSITKTPEANLWACIDVSLDPGSWLDFLLNIFYPDSSSSLSELEKDNLLAYKDGFQRFVRKYWYVVEEFPEQADRFQSLICQSKPLQELHDLIYYQACFKCFSAGPIKTIKIMPVSEDHLEMSWIRMSNPKVATYIQHLFGALCQDSPKKNLMAILEQFVSYRILLEFPNQPQLKALQCMTVWLDTITHFLISTSTLLEVRTSTGATHGFTLHPRADKDIWFLWGWLHGKYYQWNILTQHVMSHDCFVRLFSSTLESDGYDTKDKVTMNHLLMTPGVLQKYSNYGSMTTPSNIELIYFKRAFELFMSSMARLKPLSEHTASIIWRGITQGTK